MTQDEIELEAFHRIMRHLEVAVNDPRKRERLRAKTALGLIQTWLDEAENDKR